MQPGCASALERSPRGWRRARELCLSFEAQPPRTAPGQGAVFERTMFSVISEGIHASNSQRVSLARDALHTTQVRRLYPEAFQKMSPPQRVRLRSTDKGCCSTRPGRALVEILK